jgi:hypothetical protein
VCPTNPGHTLDDISIVRQADTPPVGETVQETLAERKARATVDLDSTIGSYLSTRYKAHKLDFLNALLADAQHNGLTNRGTYLEQLLAWGVTVSTGYRDVKAAAIDAASTSAEVDAVTFSVPECAASYDGTDPAVSSSAALAMPD